MFQIPLLDGLALDDAPLVRTWKGADEHIGPLEAVTPVLQRMAGKTTCGTVSIMAGLMVWGARRIRGFYDTDFCLEMAEAAFAWQHDWRYFDHLAEPYKDTPDQPPEESATFVLDDLLRGTLTGESVFYSFDQPTFPAMHMAYVVNHIMTKETRPVFEEWLKKVAGRLNRFALTPDLRTPNYDDFESRDAYRAHCAPMRGGALPPVVLDPSVDIESLDLAAAALAYLKSLDHTKNRFLRSPEDMKAMGFDGDAYGRQE